MMIGGEEWRVGVAKLVFLRHTYERNHDVEMIPC